jgi:hypothetical protein
MIDRIVLAPRASRGLEAFSTGSLEQSWPSALQQVNDLRG